MIINAVFYDLGIGLLGSYGDHSDDEGNLNKTMLLKFIKCILNKTDRELCARPSTVEEYASLFSHKSRTKFPSKSWTTDVWICSLV